MFVIPVSTLKVHAILAREGVEQLQVHYVYFLCILAHEYHGFPYLRIALQMREPFHPERDMWLPNNIIMPRLP